MKSWYSRVSDIELKDGSIRTNYVVTFETDNFKLKREVEKYLQGIMDKTEPRKEQNFCGKCRYLYRDFKYGLSCYRLMDNEPCKYEERKDEPTISKMEQVDEPQTCSVNGRPYSECAICEHFRCAADEPHLVKPLQKSRDSHEIAKDEPQAGEMMTEEEFDSMLARVLTGNNEPQTERSE